jgi:hypothetical protein
VPRVGFEFVLAHALEQGIEINVLAAANPLPLYLDFWREPGSLRPQPP